jgi:hypothetical protein
MKCTECGTYCSGDFCPNCGTILRIKETGIKPIAPRSDKMKDKDKIYNRKRKAFLKKYPRCYVYPDLKSVDVHHKRGRGLYYLDESTWIAVSRKAHQDIEANPEWAYEMGYSESRLKNYNQNEE